MTSTPTIPAVRSPSSTASGSRSTTCRSTRYISFVLASALALAACGKGEARHEVAPSAAADVARAEPAPAADVAKAEPPAPTPSDAPAAAAAAVKPVEVTPTGSPRAVALVEALERIKGGTIDEEALASLAEDVVIAQIGDPTTPELRGRGAVLAALKDAAAAIRYFTLTPSRLYEAGDWIVIDAVLFGHHAGELLGRAPSDTVTVFGVALVLACHFGEDGKVDRIEGYFDGEALRLELGILAPPPGGKERLIAGPRGGAAKYTHGAPNPANEELVRRAEAALGDGSVDAAWASLFAPGFEFDNVNENNFFRDADGYLAYWRQPTEHGVKRTPGAELERVLSVDDCVLTWGVVRGTYTGEGQARVPAGTKVDVHVFDIWTLADGRIKSRKSFTNGLEALSQLGLLENVK
ncbi:MAG: nuclear transport factor 2 family protein [Deltaproteobacteria bacterium]|nr:MAG: nuclear transport factor 2 family protein [Deltaproteobacteria bacterium]